VLSILVWWAIPAVAVVLAAAVLTASRRIRRARDDVGALDRYQRARQVLDRTQQSAGPRSHVHAQPSRPQSHPQPERTSLPTTE
jgi:hypothetical protein